MKKFAIVLSLLLISQISSAHIGGHGNDKNEKIWHYENYTEAARGSFLLVKNDDVYIEEGDDVSIIKMSKLSKTDQNYINEKTTLITSLNAKQAPHSYEKYSSSKLTVAGLILFLIGLFIIFSFKTKKRSLRIGIPVAMVLMLTIISCSSDDDETIIDEIEDLISAITDPATIKEAFDPYTNVTTSWDDDYFYVESSGIPDHQMMVGITAWIAQVPIPQPYTGDNAWSIPLNTKYAENPISIEGNFQRGAIAIAANGIPIFNPINASGLVSNDIGELDPFGGHSGRGDDYHYHTAPTHLETTSGTKPIAYALDGYAVYGSTEPNGSVMSELDAYHGHEYTDGSYHYHGTDTYPYMIAAMRGEITLEGDAPQNQVTPQPVAKPPRGGDPHGINSDNLLITDLVEKSEGNGYILSYTSDDKLGSVDYSWDENDFFTFVFNDVNGSVTTETFQR